MPKLDVAKQLKKIVHPYLERAMRIEGHTDAKALAAAMGISAPLLTRASNGVGPLHRVLDLMARGGANPNDRAEVVYLINGGPFPDSTAVDAATAAERERCIALALGCDDYSGGHSGAELAIYQHGIETVCNVLKSAPSYQTRAVEAVGRHLMGGS